MNRVPGIIMIVPVAALALSQIDVPVKARDRSEIGTEFKWKLEDLYPTEQAWNEAKQQLASRFDEITMYKGKLASSASELLACLEFDSHVSREFGRLFSYASMKSDEDTRDSKHLGMKQELQQLATDYSSSAAFIVPEIAEMDKARIDSFIEQEDGLKDFG